jgi:hypothetical protein
MKMTTTHAPRAANNSRFLLASAMVVVMVQSSSFCQAFSVMPQFQRYYAGGTMIHSAVSSSSSYPHFQLYAAASSMDDDEDTISALSPEVDEEQSLYPAAEMVTMEMTDHRPLGCTVEESLAPQDENDSNRGLQPPVFVSKLVPGGFAEKAGLRVGDVIVAVTGLFGELEVVAGLGVDKIKSYVSSVPDDEPLTIKVARGTDVYEKHEEALVELCASPQTSDKETDECVLDFLKSGYVIDDTDDEESDEICDDDSECLIDNLQNVWASDLPMPKTTSGISDNPQDTTVQKPKPWSSRSSPSGTYVRDPVTGEMRNIDPR